ncbi:MAG: ETC complex I subunit [Pseudomonadota bacterium]|nr:ETC complex I subunit [Pseudomonadota bacterium]MDE3038418.1 ETC complex I subunit [Pseudomonadota bacterium]
MTKARIYRPDKTAMQSGKAGMKEWLLEFSPDQPSPVDSLMGWNGMTDMKQEIRLYFPTKDAAVAYAKKRGIPHEVYDPNTRRQVAKAYADNFKFGRPQH